MNVLQSQEFTLTEFTVFPYNEEGKERDRNGISLINQIKTIEYYESLLDPYISMVVELVTTESFISVLSLRGGERVSFKMIKGQEATLDFTKQEGIDKCFYVQKIGTRLSKTNTELLVLNLLPKEAFTNETNRCLRRYNGIISETVRTILRDDLSTTNIEAIDKTSNSYTFIGTIKRPVQTIYWLCTKSISSNNGVTTQVTGNASSTPQAAKGTGGFLFYQTRDGFNYRSIENLVNQTYQTGSNIPTYRYSQVIEHNKPGNQFVIEEHMFIQNTDLIYNLLHGVYNNVTYMFDFSTLKFSRTQYKLIDELQGSNQLGSDKIRVPAVFKDSVSRILYRTSDSGVFSLSSSPGTERDVVDKAKAFSRYNILFNEQSLTIRIPSNFSLKVGQIIKIEFPKITESKQSKDVDEAQSGLYLIKSLRHNIVQGGMYTVLALIRDSYGLYRPKTQ